MINEETKQFLKGIDLEAFGAAIYDIFNSIDYTQKGRIEAITFNLDGFDLNFIERYHDGDYKDEVNLHFQWADIIELDKYFELRRQKELEKQEQQRLEAIEVQRRYAAVAEKKEREELERLQKKYAPK